MMEAKRSYPSMCVSESTNFNSLLESPPVPAEWPVFVNYYYFEQRLASSYHKHLTLFNSELVSFKPNKFCVQLEKLSCVNFFQIVQM